MTYLTRSPNWPPLAQKYHWRKAPTDLFWDENVSDAGPQLNFLWSKKYHWCKAPTDLLWSKHSLTTDHLDVLIWRFYETYYWKSCEADISKLGGAQWMASLQLAGPGWTRREEWHRMFNWFAFIMSTKIYLLHFWYHHIFLNQYLYYLRTLIHGYSENMKNWSWGAAIMPSIGLIGITQPSPYL